MKKVIVIASAVITILLATYLIIIATDSWFRITSRYASSIGVFIAPIIILLFIILISLLVMFNIRLTKSLRILLVAISIPLGLLGIFMFGMNFYSFIKNPASPPLFVFYYIIFMAMVITLLTYIIRSLRPSETKGTKIVMNRTILILVGLTCGLITAAAIYTILAPGQHGDPISYYEKPIFYRKDYEERITTIRNIEESGSNDSAQIIRRFLADKNESVRREAVQSLWRLKDKESIPEIRKLLKDNNDRVRYFAISILVEFDDKESIPEIIKLLQNNDLEIRELAVRALGKFGAKEAIPEIIRLLQDNESGVRWSAVCSLLDLDAKEAIPELVKLLQDDNWAVQKSAEDALRQFGMSEEEIEDAKKGK